MHFNHSQFVRRKRSALSSFKALSFGVRPIINPKLFLTSNPGYNCLFLLLLHKLWRILPVLKEFQRFSMSNLQRTCLGPRCTHVTVADVDFWWSFLTAVLALGRKLINVFYGIYMYFQKIEPWVMSYLNLPLFLKIRLSIFSDVSTYVFLST